MCSICGIVVPALEAREDAPIARISLWTLLKGRPLADTVRGWLVSPQIMGVGQVRFLDLYYEDRVALLQVPVTPDGVVSIPEDFLHLRIDRVGLPDAQRQRDFSWDGRRPVLRRG